VRDKCEQVLRLFAFATAGRSFENYLDGVTMRVMTFDRRYSTPVLLLLLAAAPAAQP
jgi:hypothetical protein